jgi:hypothetical protein
VASATALSRAADFAGKLPTVSRKYLEYAESLATHDFQDREMSMRATGGDGMSAAQVRKSIREQNDAADPHTERALMKSLLYDCTEDEVERFMNYPWEFNKIADHDMFRDSLPPAWRK